MEKSMEGCCLCLVGPEVGKKRDMRRWNCRHMKLIRTNCDLHLSLTTSVFDDTVSVAALERHTGLAGDAEEIPWEEQLGA